MSFQQLQVLDIIGIAHVWWRHLIGSAIFYHIVARIEDLEGISVVF